MKGIVLVSAAVAIFAVVGVAVGDAVSDNAKKSRDLSTEGNDTRPHRVSVAQDSKEPGPANTITTTITITSRPSRPEVRPTSDGGVSVGLEFKPVDGTPVTTNNDDNRNSQRQPGTSDKPVVGEGKEPVGVVVNNGRDTNVVVGASNAGYHSPDGKEPVNHVDTNKPIANPTTTTDADVGFEGKEKGEGKPSGKALKRRQQTKTELQCTFPYNPYLDPFFAGTWMGENCVRRRRCGRRPGCPGSSEGGRGRARDPCGRPIPGRRGCPNNLQPRSLDNGAEDISNAARNGAKWDVNAVAPIEKPLLPFSRPNNPPDDSSLATVNMGEFDLV